MLQRTALVLSLLVAVIRLCALPIPACAQAAGQEDGQRLSLLRLVNLDTPTLPAAGKTACLADVRVFGAQEDTLYGTLQLARGLSESLAVLLRGSASEVKTFAGPGFDIRHGGTDIEILGRWRSPQHPHLGLEVGLAWANTPAQQDVFFTAQLLYQRPLGSRFVLHFAPKAVFVKDDPIVGIGGGISARLTDSLAIVGDLTGIVSGSNTRSVLTGAKVRSEVWGAALRWRPRPSTDEASGTTEWTFDIGATNGLGGTTGFSLTPGLSGSTAVYASLTMRR